MPLTQTHRTRTSHQSNAHEHRTRAHMGDAHGHRTRAPHKCTEGHCRGVSQKGIAQGYRAGGRRSRVRICTAVLHDKSTAHYRTKGHRTLSLGVTSLGHAFDAIVDQANNVDKAPPTRQYAPEPLSAIATQQLSNGATQPFSRQYAPESLSVIATQQHSNGATRFHHHQLCGCRCSSNSTSSLNTSAAAVAP